jgi:anthranilate/para-aminobenzoate synthase component II
VIRNDHNFDLIDFSSYKAVIISPGPSNPDNAGITLDVIGKNPGLPLLGICLGMQAIVQSFGERLSGLRGLYMESRIQFHIQVKGFSRCTSEIQSCEISFALCRESEFS